MRAAVSWVRIKHCASPDLNGYKARARTLSASQVTFVSWGSVVGQNEWARQTGLENDWEKKGVFSLSVCECLDYIYSPFLCLTSESMLLSSATGTKQIHFITKLKKKKKTSYMEKS